jgi:hypothetical protein
MFHYIYILSLKIYCLTKQTQFKTTVILSHFRGIRALEFILIFKMSSQYSTQWFVGYSKLQVELLPLTRMQDEILWPSRKIST